MKPLTLISSIMVIKNFAIEGCVIEDVHNARLELANPNQTYSSTYSHLHLSLLFYFKKINYYFYFDVLKKVKEKIRLCNLNHC